MHGHQSSYNAYGPPASQPPRHAPHSQSHQSYDVPPSPPPLHGTRPQSAAYGNAPAPAPRPQSMQHGGGGGYGQFAGVRPPPDPNAQLRQWFSAVDTDRSGQITEQELKTALVNGDWSQFSDETVKMSALSLSSFPFSH
ncbi:hypothetical protein JCM10213_001984 [Rhodosporidiobolus nylandii]